MHRTISTVCLGLLLMLAASLASAEESEPMHLGLGLGMSAQSGWLSLFSAVSTDNNGSELLLVPTSFYVPINITPSFRLEPSIGFYRTSNDASTKLTPTSTTTSTSSESGTLVAVGLGAFYVMKPADAFRIYTGPRLDLLFISSSDTTSQTGVGASPTVTDTSSRNGWTISGAVGGEYYPISRLSFGAEAALGFGGLGTPSTTSTSSGGSASTASVSTSTNTTIRTVGTLFVRIFFF